MVIYLENLSPSGSKTATAEDRKKEPKDDKDSDLTKIRGEKYHARTYHDVAKLRAEAAEHSAKAAKYYSKYREHDRKREAYIAKAVKKRETAEKFMERSKEMEAKAAEYESDMSAGLGNPEKLRVKAAKMREKAADMKKKAALYESKAAAYNEKAAKYREMAAEALEKSKMHEVEAKNFTRRANKIADED